MRFVPFALPEPALRQRLDALRWRFRKWDTHVRGRSTLAPGALVLTREDAREVARVAEEVAARCDAAMARWPRDAGMTHALGVPEELVPLARGTRPRITRVDLFPTAQGWMASECNDDVPGGYNDALGLPALFADAVEKDLEPPGDLPEAILRMVGDARRVGLVYATAYAEDLQVVRLVADLLELDGRACVLASPAHLEPGGRLDGQQVDAIFRFFPGEWFPALPNLDAWRETVDAGVPVANPFATLWTQSKLAFAHLDHPAIPRTVPLTRERVAEARAGKDALVLKPAFGRMGEAVVLGIEETEASWEKALAAALRRRMPTALQARFDPLRVEVRPGVTATPCVGAYVVDGRFAGCYSRISERRVVRFDAANVLTLVETV